MKTIESMMRPEILWWNELHQEAVEKLDLATDWARPSQISDRPEVIRDLLSLGMIEAKEVEGNPHQPQNRVFVYGKSLNYLKED